MLKLLSKFLLMTGLIISSCLKKILIINLIFLSNQTLFSTQERVITNQQPMEKKIVPNNIKKKIKKLKKKNYELKKKLETCENYAANLKLDLDWHLEHRRRCDLDRKEHLKKMSLIQWAFIIITTCSLTTYKLIYHPTSPLNIQK